jgi:2-(3-amino-3-carboxypropyl)histidine synthase
MQREKTIQEIEKEYDLELNRIIKTIKKEKAKNVLLQFPDGMKPYSTVIAKYLESKIKDVEFFIWLGSCFGACDLPPVSDEDIDLIVQFGHSPWPYKKEQGIKVLK